MNKNSALFTLIIRHFIVFMGNKIRLLYTLLVPVIIFLIYIILLRSLESEMMNSALKDLGLLSNGTWLIPSMEKDIHILMDYWMMSGILGISAITISIQSNNIMVEDKENGVNRDFVSSPISRRSLILSYFLFNFIITYVLCLIVLGIVLIYVAIINEFVLTFLDILLNIATTGLASLTSTLITMFICSFIKRESTLASIIAVFSAAIGFLIGAYMPLGLFPSWIQGFCCFLPSTYNVSLLRYSFLSGPLKAFEATYKPQLSPEIYQNLQSNIANYGYELNFYGTMVGVNIQAIIISIFFVVFAVLAIISSRLIDEITKK